MPAEPKNQSPANKIAAPLSKCGKVRVEAVFDEPELSSDGGALLIREVARNTGIVDSITGAIADQRRQSSVSHSYGDLIMQRLTQISLGYEDANDCDFLREDWALKAAVGKIGEDAALGSQSTMTRLENSVTQRDLIGMFYGLIDNFLDGFSEPPEQLVLDVDPTAIRTYGQQELAIYNAHYGGHCLMPFHVYEGLSGRLIATVIRSGKTPTKEEIIALIKRIVRRIRERFPQARLIFRADSHHCKPGVLEWLEDNEVNYVVGLATNSVLRSEVAHLEDQVQGLHGLAMKKVRRFHSFEYAAGSWNDCRRRVVARVEATPLGTDSRFIVTDLRGASAKCLYETVYCDRGTAELFIKEHKCFLHSDRTSCKSALANQFRLMLHSAAYVVMHELRRSLLSRTELAAATFRSIRLRVLKTAARVEIGKTFVRFHLPARTAPVVAAAFRKAAAFAALAASG